jgi:hypothetical protein
MLKNQTTFHISVKQQANLEFLVWYDKHLGTECLQGFSENSLHLLFS